MIRTKDKAAKDIVRRACVSLLLTGCAAIALSQKATVDTYPAEELERLAQPLHAQAQAAKGTASTTLAEYPGHLTMLVYRDKSGEVEVHEKFADVMMVMGGNATLVTGGTTQNGRVTKPGEIRGTSIAGGSSTSLKKGELIHIAANTPHQVLILPGNSITYLVIKVETIAR